METLNLLQSGQLVGSQRLDLAAGLTHFPAEIFKLADSLEILNLSHNQLNALPDEFACLQQLKILFLSHNNFATLPAVLSQCPKLSMVGFKANRIKTVGEDALPPSVRWLILTDNQIDHLPASIGHLVHLQKLMLAGNRLRSLPDTLANCHNLELIRLAANQLPSLPTWLFTLPRLSWLAYSGNPFCSPTTQQTQLPDIDWAALAIAETLGEGASGVIYKGIWQTQTGATDVAVKLFKGEVTSDGLPADEMAAYIAAESHPNLVSVLGRLCNHPAGKAGLVFAFIPPSYQNLGQPPNFETCTRDTYPPDTQFSVPVILQITQGIAAVVAHLHSKGIMHGDLYAHNILVNETGDSLLGDFGAACFYDRTDQFLAAGLEPLEVRAFGCLLEDLLDRCKTVNSMEQTICDRLRQLQQNCLLPTPAMRPPFTQICKILAQLSQHS